jgi:hypothetical protein
LTPLKLFALKSGILTEEGDSPTKRRGRYFEPVVADILREDYPDWTITKHTSYFWDEEKRLGATPDFWATRPLAYGPLTIQVKTVGQFAFRRHWHTPEGEIAVPLWVAVQANVEAYLTGAAEAGVAALRLGDGGLDVLYVDIPLKLPLIRKIEELADEFWLRIKENRPYEPELPGRDRQLVMDLWEPGPAVDLSHDDEFTSLVFAREGLMKIERDARTANEQRKQVDAQLIRRMGNSSRAIVDGGAEVMVAMIDKKSYTVRAQHYPLIRLKPPKVTND